MSRTSTISLPANFFERDNVRALYLQKDGEAALILFLQLLCHASKQDRNGTLMLYGAVPLTDEIIARMTFKSEKDIAKLMGLLLDFFLISLHEGVYSVVNYAHYCRKKRHGTAAKAVPILSDNAVQKQDNPAYRGYGFAENSN